MGVVGQSATRTDRLPIHCYFTRTDMEDLNKEQQLMLRKVFDSFDHHKKGSIPWSRLSSPSWVTESMLNCSSQSSPKSMPMDRVNWNSPNSFNWLPSSLLRKTPRKCRMS